MNPNFVVMAALGAERLAAKFLDFGESKKLATVTRRSCPDGETLLRLDLSELEGRDLILIGTTANDKWAFELYALACAAQQYRIRSLFVIVDDAAESFGSARDLADLNVEEAMRLRMLKSIPQSPFGNRFFLNRQSMSILDSVVFDEKDIVPLRDEPQVGKDFAWCLGKNDALPFRWQDLFENVGLPIDYDVETANDGPLLISTRNYQYLTSEVASLSGLPQLKATYRQVGDRDVLSLDRSAVYGRDIIVVGGTPSEVDLFEVYRLCNAAVDAGALSLRIVCPYFGWQAMERSDEQGNEVVTAKVAARLLSSIPRARLGNTMQMFDLHAAGIPHYFEGSMRRAHIYLKPLTMAAIVDGVTEREIRLSSVDVGRFGWVVSLAGDITEAGEVIANPAGVFKIRLSEREVAPVAHAGNVDGFTTIVFDDFTRTGGSIDRGSLLLDESGAKEIIVVLSHGIRAENPLEVVRTLYRSGKVSRVIVFNTLPSSQALPADKIEVRSIAPLIVDNL